jgi:hypothetical protein
MGESLISEWITKIIFIIEQEQGISKETVKLLVIIWEISVNLNKE